jgi:ATP-binding cassette, subfamily F, member 3
VLTLTDIAIRRGPRALFSGLSLTVYPGQRVGVLGSNGVGKTSLFAAILGER